MIVMALSDTIFSWMSARDMYVGGSIVDYGWMIAAVSLAVGASLALDSAAAYRFADEHVPAASETATTAATSSPQ